MLVVLRQSGRQADDEDDAQVVDDGHHSVVERLPEHLDGAPLEEGQQAGNGAVGQQHADDNQDARSGQVHQRLYHRLGELFQCAHDFVFHFVWYLLP